MMSITRGYQGEHREHAQEENRRQRGSVLGVVDSHDFLAYGQIASVPDLLEMAPDKILVRLGHSRLPSATSQPTLYVRQNRPRLRTA
jgi:hypothetical protein